MKGYFKALFALLAVAATICAQTPWDGTIDTSWYSPWSWNDPLTITTAEQLAGLAHLVNRENNHVHFSGRTVFLGADIDLGGRNWTPIGERWGEHTFHSFEGTFDGDGYSISNLSIIRTDINERVALGLFGSSSGGTIKNLTLEVKEITAHINSQNVDISLGGLVGITGWSGINIENVAVNIIDSISIIGEVSMNSSIGGLAGRVNRHCIIANSSVQGNISVQSLAPSLISFNKIGGLIGGSFATSARISIINSHFNGNIYVHSISNRVSAGGLLGCITADLSGNTIERLIISNSYSIANVFLTGVASGISPLVVYGGLTAGTPTSLFSITNSYASGTISNRISGNRVAIGGIIGQTNFAFNSMVPEYSSVYYNSTMTNRAFGLNDRDSFADTSGIAALTPMQLTRQASFVGWDFNDTWGIFENMSFPFHNFKRIFGGFNVEIPSQSYIYTGSQIRPEPMVYWVNAQTLEPLRRDIDYTITYGDNRNAGAGVGRITITGIGDYQNLREGRANFTITPKEFTITANVRNKVFDGGTSAEIIGTPVIVGVLADDEVSITGITANFENINPGSEKNVNFRVNFGGRDARNYSFVHPLITADITPAPLTVSLYPRVINITTSDTIPDLRDFLQITGNLHERQAGDPRTPVDEWTAFTIMSWDLLRWAVDNDIVLGYGVNLSDTVSEIAVARLVHWHNINTPEVRNRTLPAGTYALTFIPTQSDRYDITFDDEGLFLIVNDDGTFIRSRHQTDSRFGILLESAIVSDVARINVITPEPAQINLRILDNLGNVVFTETSVRAGFKPAPTNAADNAIVWNLTNQSGRYVANGTYLIIVETQCLASPSGRRFTYSARIGVNR